MSFVLDASVTMRWFFEDGSQSDRDYSDAVLKKMKNSKVSVPVTWGLELANVLARAEKKLEATAKRIDAFVERLRHIDVLVDDATFEFALSDTLYLARKYKLSSYDASYLELAMRLKLPLATLDENLRKAAKKVGVKDIV
ncbi:MAG: type II toxin-antitoxin system VapC family toxin [Pyrinomonadaceae bacterium]